MNNVIHADFGQDDDKSGYVTEDCKDGMKKITGVYVDNISAMVDRDGVYLGVKAINGIDNPLLTNMDDINQFCLMWLCLFDPNVIAEDKD